MEAEIAVILPRLKEAIEAMMNPLSTQQDRLNAYEVFFFNEIPYYRHRQKHTMIGMNDINYNLNYKHFTLNINTNNSNLVRHQYSPIFPSICVVNIRCTYIVACADEFYPT